MWDEKKVRIVDIAEALGLSTATVSNVLHGKTKKISDSTVKRVQEALRDSGYIPNMAATLLAQNSSRILGVVVNDHPKYEGYLLEDPFVSGALNALADEIEAAGYFMMLRKARAIMEAIPFASMWNMDGMILLGFCADEYQALRDRIRIPFVVYDGFFDNRGNVCSLLLDDRDGGRQVGEYLRAGGHRNVLCLADNRLLPDWDRYQGLCEGLGIPADLWEIPMNREERERYYEERTEDFRKYTAVFAVSDHYAVDVMYHLLGKGFAVPEDISVIGFDGSALSALVRPRLTTVVQDMRYRAAKAMEYLMRIREDGSRSVTETVPVKLILRESSRAAEEIFTGGRSSFEKTEGATMDRIERIRAMEGRMERAALDMFSQNGYAGTNIRELTAALGLVKSGVYKHFGSKEDIWNSLLDELIAYYEARFGSPEHLPPVPDSMEELVSMTMRMVDFTVHDEKVVKTRKLLSIEQFRDERAKELATKHFLTGLTQIFTHVFSGMMDKGLLRRDDAEMLAFAYTSPISALIHLCDREPEKTEEAMARVEAFSRHFVGVYGEP